MVVPIKPDEPDQGGRPHRARQRAKAVVRTATVQIQRTEVKDELRVLREQLDPEQHEILLLRLDRGLAWKDIARVLGGPDNLDGRAAALRKRFERAKERLKKLAIDHGLIRRS